MAYEAKTKVTNVSVKEFVASLPSEKRREEATSLVKIFESATGWKAQMWGPTIIGFGRYSYTYDSGHTGDMCVVGFSPRKAAISIYGGCRPRDIPDLMAKLGKTKVGNGGCIYVNKLADIDTKILEKLIHAGVANVRRSWHVSAK